MDLHMESDSKELYQALEEMAALYYRTNNKGKVDFSSDWLDMMINCVVASSYFNTYRMLDQYKQLVWNFPATYPAMAAP